MSSPFPGMDPYLEHPDFWPECHHWLISLIAETLVPQVRPKYRVAIEKRVYEIGITNGNGNSNSLLVGIPDIAIKRQPTDPDSLRSNVAIAPPLTQPLTVTVPVPEQIKQAYLEVRDLATGSVVVAIEILSPVNKRSGDGRETYLTKRQRILGSLTHLVEIDLLRGWEPMPMFNCNITSDYRVLISRKDRRPSADLYAFNLSSPLPSFSIPLRSGDPEPILDLQTILNTVYDRAGYDYAIDYTQPTVPPLPDTDAAWADALLQAKGLRSPSS
jgi:Protein of unknown function (DUF4058)